MEKFFREWRRYWWIAIVLGIAYLATRLLNLTALPIFTDEAIYIRWSQIGGNDAAWRFISLVDGKQPLFTWVMMGTLRLFRDPLVAGRMVSVMAGVGSLIGIGFLSWELFHSKRITLLSLLLYLVCPFSLWYDRLAIYDSLSAAIAFWNIYLAVRLVRHLKLDIALIFGLTLGLGMINKTTGFLSLYMLPLTLLLFDWGEKERGKRLLRWVYLAIVAAVLSQLIYGILRLSPLYGMIAQKDHVFIHPFSDFPILLRYFQGNMTGLFDWFIHYVTIPIFLAIIGVIFIRGKNYRERLFLLGWWFFPFVGLGYFAKILYPRFVLFMILPLLTLAAFTIDWIIRRFQLKIRVIALLLVMIFPSIFTSFYIITNPTYAPIPYADRGQMIDDWPAGGGIKEVNQFLNSELEKGKVTVFTDGTFGLLPYAIEIYFWNNPNMTIQALYPLPEEFPPAIKEASLHQPTYVILNQTQIPPPKWPLQSIAEYQKGTNKDVKLRLYRVIPPIASL